MAGLFRPGGKKCFLLFHRHHGPPAATPLARNSGRLEPFAETPLQPRNAGAAHPEQRRSLLQGGMRQGRQEYGLGGTQLFHVGGLDDNGAGLGNEFRIDPAGPGHAPSYQLLVSP